MYVPEQKITGVRNTHITNFIKDNDIFNSKFLYLLPRLPMVDTYTINRYEMRIDLISMDMYGQDVSDLILLYNNVKVEDLLRGTILAKFSLDDLDNLIISLDDN